MTAINKILLGLLGLITICFVSFVIYKEQQLAKMQAQIQSSVVAMQQLQDNITRSQSQFATKSDIESLAAANQISLATIEKNMSSINDTLSAINVVTANSNGQNTNNIPSTSTTPISPPPTNTTNNSPVTTCPTDPFGYQSNVQNLVLNEQFNAGIGSNGDTQVPIGQVSFDAAQKSPWSINIIPRQYSIVNVLGTSKEGIHSVYNKFSVIENGKSYPVDITSAKYEEEYPSSSMSWWNPHLFFSANLGINISDVPVKGEFDPSLNVGIMSYGKTKTNPDISILQVGVGYATVAHTPVVSISPVNFNIGNALSTSFIDNTYLGPNFSIGFNGNVIVGAGLSVGF